MNKIITPDGTSGPIFNRIEVRGLFTISHFEFAWGSTLNVNL